MGNRLYSMASAKQFALNDGRDLSILWPLRWELNAKFTDFWEPNGFKIIYIDEYNWPLRWINKLDIVEKCLSANSYIINDVEMYHIRDEINGYNFSNYLEKYREHNRLFMETCFNFYPNRMLKLNEIFIPKKYILDIINTWIETNENEYIGLHIRRTDHANAIGFSPNELFCEVIENHPQEKFFLCTDDVQTENYFSKKYSSQIMTYSKNKQRNSSSGMLCAIIDLLLLSRSRIIYGSYNSTYSSFAAEFENKELVVLKK